MTEIQDRESKVTRKKRFKGIVVSEKMDKTVVVEVSRRQLDPLYKKYVTKSSRYKAHDEDNTARKGDTVQIVECRPVSKEKCWVLHEIVERAR